MSLVGPRPLIESEDAQLDRLGAQPRLDLTPGLTGLWQVLGRTNIPFEEMVKLDYLYVTNWSLWTDIRLILRTLPVVLPAAAPTEVAIDAVILGKGSLAIRVADWFMRSDDYALTGVVPVVPEPDWSGSLIEWARANEVHARRGAIGTSSRSEGWIADLGSRSSTTGSFPRRRSPASAGF